MPNTTHPRGTVNADSTIMLAEYIAEVSPCWGFAAFPYALRSNI